MEALRQLLSRIQEQLAVMTRSQQIAIGLCVVIIAGSFLWLMQWSTEPQLEPLLDQPMTVQEMAAVAEHLQTIGAEFEEVGDRIYVKPDERRKLQRELAVRGALPEDTSLGFENLLKDQSPFLPESVNQRNFRIALQNELAAVIAAAPEISTAKVFINDAMQRRVGARPSLEPTASVNVTTSRGRQVDQAGVQAVANVVSGAVAALEPHNVKVSVNGRPRNIPAPDEVLSFGLLEEKKKNEKHFHEKILNLLDYIPGVKVAVAVELETTRSVKDTTDYTEPQPKSETTMETRMQSGSSSSEAGVNPNTGTALTGPANGQNSSTEEGATEYFDSKVAVREREERIPLTVKTVTASINIPRSYFASVYKAQNLEANEPTDADLQVLIDIEQKRVSKQVRNLIASIGMPDTEVVQVDWFPDLVPGSGKFADSPLALAGEAEGGEGTVGMMASYVPQAGLAGLALVALAMMFMMVRKSGRMAESLLPEPPVPDEDEDVPLQQAELTEGFLMGQEVDEDTLRISNLSEQVSKMVDSDPETAADLIRRWVEQD